MIRENDKIAVCISGGKDSMLMAKLFQELKRHNKFPFELVFLVMDPGYSEANRKIIENNAKLMDIPITILNPRYLMRCMISRIPPAICVRECAGAISTVTQRSWGAIRSLWDTITMM